MKDIEIKIKKAFSGGRDTIEEHRKKGGNPDIDVCYQYLDLFLEEDDKKLSEIYSDYKSGKLLTGELKKYTITKLQDFLKKHQQKRNKAKKIVNKFLK
jgi:tryptophanyl-tRNA synthetase